MTTRRRTILVGARSRTRPRASLAVVRRSSIRMFRSATSATQRKHRSIPPSQNLRRRAPLRITAPMRVAGPYRTRALGCRWRRSGQVRNARRRSGCADVELSGSTGALCRMRRQPPANRCAWVIPRLRICDPPAQVGKRCRLRPGWRIRPTSAARPGGSNSGQPRSDQPCVLLARRVHRPHGGPVRRCVLGFEAAEAGGLHERLSHDLVRECR